MENETTLNFTFTVERTNVILNALAELPFRLAADVINDIREQATAQAQEPARSEAPVKAED